jgi:hypothetical protein
MIKHMSGTQWLDDRVVRVMLCAIYTVHKETRCTCFWVWPQNQGRQFLPIWPQNRQLQFGILGLKITVIVSWFGPQNQVGYGLSVVPQNQRKDEDGAGHALRSGGLLWLKASRTRVFQSGLKN